MDTRSLDQIYKNKTSVNLYGPDDIDVSVPLLRRWYWAVGVHAFVGSKPLLNPQAVHPLLELEVAVPFVVHDRLATTCDPGWISPCSMCCSLPAVQIIANRIYHDAVLIHVRHGPGQSARFANR